MLKENIGLYTDLYELTMAQGYFHTGRKDSTACFDYFFRKTPFQGTYVIFSGLRTLYQLLENFEYSSKDCDYLSSIGFTDDFLEFLSGFRFKGTIYSPEEGDVVFPFEPIMRVEGRLIETQLIETILLNTINFESLIATKASRVKHAAGDNTIAEFGLRRAQGFGGIQASRASIIGGADSTSNVYNACHYKCAASGTQAHSWVQSYDSEIEAFRAYAKTFPDKCILLVDTYNTLKSGIPNAIKVAKELEEKDHHLIGIRLDSGDLLQLSVEARKMLNEAGLDYVKIIASNQIDEFIIDSLLSKGAPIDVFGVGTSLATGNPDGALDGIYKMCFCDGKPRLKLSENPEKVSYPSLKKVYRFLDQDGYFLVDGVFLKEETVNSNLFERLSKQILNFNPEKSIPLLKKTMENGKSLLKIKDLYEIRENTFEQIKKLPVEHRKLKGGEPYLVGFSEKLLSMQQEVIKEIKRKKTIAE